MSQALFMAAGLGSRISKDIDGLPKCLLPIENQPLLLRNIIHFESLSIECVVAVGYQADLVKKAISTSKAITVENTEYASTNSIVSLDLALKKLTLDEDLIIMNADVCYDFKMLTELGELEDCVYFLGDSSRKYEADYKFIWNDKKEITDFGKNIDASRTSGEYIGIAIIPQNLVPILKSKVSEYVNSGITSKWWEEVILENRCLFNYKIIDSCGTFWAEFDYIEDYQRAINYFSNP